MAEFVAFEPNVEVLGISMLSVTEAMGEQAYGVMEKHGLINIDPESWYPQQTYLDAYHELSTLGFFNMVSVGMKVPDNAKFPPVNSVEEALKLLNTAYQMNHRGGDIGEYRYEKVNESEARMICRTPYPSDFDYGLIYRLVQKFAPKGSHVVVVRDENAPSRKNGDDSCTYIVKW